jgi:hypothetical protein
LFASEVSGCFEDAVCSFAGVEEECYFFEELGEGCAVVVAVVGYASVVVVFLDCFFAGLAGGFVAALVSAPFCTGSAGF